MSNNPTQILVPTDFSHSANRALPLAKRIARCFDSEIHLLHVRELLDDPIVDSEILDQVEQILTDSEPAMRDALEEAGRDSCTPIHTHLKKGIVPAQIIIDAIDEYDCDLVIMGTEGRRGLKRLLTGSVAQEVLHRSPIPVLTIRDGVHTPSLPKKLLVAVDFSETSLEAVEWAASAARVFDAKVTLLHVVETLVYSGFYGFVVPPEPQLKEIMRDCYEALSEIAAKHFTDVPCTTTVINDHAALGIASYAQKHEQELVILATKGRSGLAHIALGSVAERVVRLSEVPVLTVRKSR